MPHLPFNERDIERMLEGDVPPGRGDLVELARLFARLRAEVEGEPVPPMSARLLAELDASELEGRLRSEIERGAEQRRVQRGRRRWRAVAAAAAIAVVGGVAIATVRGPIGDDLRTRPGDDPVSVAESDGGPSSTVGDGSSGGVETADPDDGPPIYSPSEEGSSDDLGVASGSSGSVVTTEVPTTASPTTAPPDGGDVNWDDVADECGRDTDCVIDAAERECDESGVECWADAADACGYDPGCRGMLNNLCGDSRECNEAIWEGQPSDHRP